MSIVYPYIPNSNPRIKKEMLDVLGRKNVQEIYDFIPKDLCLQRTLDLPEPYLAESDLKKHMEQILARNITCEEYTSFLGAGCYDHYVPAVCDEINGRAEFLTAYSGDTYADHGKTQAFFEFTSLMGELLEMDVVSFPTYDGAQAACTGIMIASRINGRKEILLPKNINKDIYLQIKTYCIDMEINFIAYGKTGQLDLSDLEKRLSEKTACVFIQNPTFFGHFEEQGEAIAKLVHGVGAEFIVYADPASLGVIDPPAKYGADIVCGDIQPLGIHMGYGSGLGGYLATRVEEKYVLNYPHHLYGIFENEKGERGFFRSLPERTSFLAREAGVEFLGTCVGLWAITAAVYLSVMGPDGMYDLGRNILYKSNYAKKELSSIPGVKVMFPESAPFQELAVNFDGCGKTVHQINQALLEAYHIFGGKDLCDSFYSLGQTALFCFTEKTEKADIDKMVSALRKIVSVNA